MEISVQKNKKISKKTKIKKPNKYAVYILNDDYTPWNFVVQILIKIFNKTEQEANELTSNVHNQGQGLCGIYTREIAETKVQTATEFARLNKHPLRIIMRAI